MFNRIFRQRALRRRARQEPLDDRLQVTAPHEWLIVAGLVVALAALVAYAAIGRVERTVSYQATLILPGERHHLVAPASGYITDVLAATTETVGPGQPIAHISASSAQRRTAAIAEIMHGLIQNEQLEEDVQRELLRALLVSGTTAAPSSPVGDRQPASGRNCNAATGTRSAGVHRRNCGPDSRGLRRW